VHINKRVIKIKAWALLHSTLEAQGSSLRNKRGNVFQNEAISTKVTKIIFGNHSSFARH